MCHRIKSQVPIHPEIPAIFFFATSRWMEWAYRGRALRPNSTVSLLFIFYKIVPPAFLLESWCNTHLISSPVTQTHLLHGPAPVLLWVEQCLPVQSATGLPIVGSHHGTLHSQYIDTRNGVDAITSSLRIIEDCSVPEKEERGPEPLSIHDQVKYF